MTANVVPGTAAERWRSALDEWAIPAEIEAAAPEPPWGFPPSVFAKRAERTVAETVGSPSQRRAAEAVPEGGTVLDVGVGGGAGCLPLAPPCRPAGRCRRGPGHAGRVRRRRRPRRRGLRGGAGKLACGGAHALLGRDDEPRRGMTIWWDGAA